MVGTYRYVDPTVQDPLASTLVAIAEEVTALAREARDPELALDSCFLRRMAWLSVGDTERAATIAEEHRALANELKQPSQQ